MTEREYFVPPFSQRSETRLPPLELIRRARRNMLELFHAASFNFQFSSARLLTRRFFICNWPELVQQVLSVKTASFERKSAQMRHALKPVAGDGLIISDGAIWRSRRKLVSPIMHISRMRDFAPVMVETAAEMRERWSALPGPGQVEVMAEMAELTAEIITRTIFGRQLGRADAREVIEGFSAYQHETGRLDLLWLAGVPDWVWRPRGRRIRRAVRRIHTVLDRIIDDIAARPEAGGPSIVSRLIEARDEETGEPLSREAIRNEAAVMFLAGHETTASTLSFVWYLLSQDPITEGTVHAELDAVLGGRLPTLADVPQLRWTRAVIEETLRLYPPIPFLAREASQDETIRNHRVPKGSIVVVVPWLLHRHRALWHKPDAFMPHRFMPGSPEPRSKFAYVPFSIGPRICAGMSFGLTESILCVAVLAQRLRLTLEPGHVVEPVCRLTLRPGDVLPMRVEPRPGAADASEPASSDAPAAGCPLGHG